MGHYVHVRQQYLISPSHSSTAQARTVLVTGIPQEYLTESALTSLFSHLPGGVHKVWINRDLRDMPELYDQRLKACQMLESAATSLLNKAIERNRQRFTNPAKFGDGRDVVSNVELTDFVSDPETRDNLLEKLVSKHERPSHKLPLLSWIPASIPLLGKKVDTIEWACEQIQELNNKLAQRREILAHDITRMERTHKIDTEKSNITISAVPDSILPYGTRAVVDFSGLKYPPADGAFILFNKQIAAHMAAQTLTHHGPYCMPYSLKYVEATPEDVIWKNLALNPYQRRLRVVLSWTVGIVLIMGWTIPGRPRLNSAQSTSRAKCIYIVWFVTTASRLPSGECIFIASLPICNTVGKVTHVLMGILYAVLLTVLFMFPPTILRVLARWEGTTQRTHVELSLMNRVFVIKIIVRTCHAVPDKHLSHG